MNKPKKSTVQYCDQPIDIYKIKTNFGELAGVSEEDAVNYASNVEKFVSGSELFEGKGISPDLSRKLRILDIQQENTPEPG